MTAAWARRAVLERQVNDAKVQIEQDATQHGGLHQTVLKRKLAILHNDLALAERQAATEFYSSPRDPKTA
jgi:hypothetical protein